MAKIPFNVDAYTARLIGRENVSKLEGAVIEMVKNTYDADATISILYYDEEKDVLYLADNGCGMTEETIRKHWMTIGRSSKRNSYVSKGGRIQTGEKGIGRFALDRIAEKCQMLTKTADGKMLLWSVDWSSFLSGKNITDINADIEEIDCKFDAFFDDCANRDVAALIRKEWGNQGTIFRLNSLRENWDGKLVKKIRENLSSLIPYELSTVYKIYCFDNENTQENAEVFSNADAYSYDYKIEFHVSNSGPETEQGEIHVKLWRAEFDFGSDEDIVLKGAGLYDEKKIFS